MLKEKRLFAFLKDQRRLLILHLSGAALSAVTLVLWAIALADSINRLFFLEQTLDQISDLLIILLLLTLLRAALTYFTELTAHEIGERVKDDLRARLTEHLLRLGPRYTQNERSGELATALSQAPEDIATIFSQYLPALFLAAIVPLIVLLFVFPIDLLSGVVMLVTAPLIPFFMILIGSIAGQLARRQYAALSLMSAHFLDVLQGLTTLKLFNREGAQTEMIRTITDRFRRTTLSVVRIAFLSALALEFLATISIAIIAVEIGIRLLYGFISFDRALFILIIAPEFYTPLRTLGARFHTGTNGAAAAKRVFAILETQPPVHPAVAQPPSLSNYTIRFEAVSYAYGDRAALHAVSFEIPHGKQTALIGHSGAGKSTVAALLLGFLTPDSGRISVGGTPLEALPITWWRDQVAWLPQKPYLFNGTVLENIRHAKPESTDEEVYAAAQAAAVHNFILSLPEGYHTPIGERGARLSGGQVQRIAIARAFLKNAPVIVLDEATANLDAETEQQITAALKRLCEGRTALIIAHRLSTVAQADQIVVLSGGRVVEYGSPQALLQREGAYRALVMAASEPLPQGK
ncbi:MAG: thiol reductant ABC exporter subunit CydD [Candidatus Thermofonsia Clade 1 bacterium]|uniref:Thiol reductant ABC exporter subunit CydD n=1 Tax=Candidatus Thermofonsia Clade 1 bacterium TaxID=2364210 RepID=A0A2M8P097_9CHLR|nr:MAG: thiol reductant ABC exporter subunit CydD [Candidatus Thermofonsia Clade 1 bacterium]